ncbi:hypothetical protein V5P93_007201 [Actinokineospora auranticolor]|uniref:Uncharacterized protein n=1 Tax=Actinokineospora auranticolor TaxID=155976 RepID=A0A2S6GRN3_9PSEU|nr:hypothetical protein [Actinokineospora auranticolor]PPK67859.1 hypothetical protein CLV40_10689 [Actinokineospora auranticolor]
MSGPGWAVVGKRPGDDADYAVLAASAEPFTHAQLTAILLDAAPGHSPAVDAEGAAALPWVWFVPVRSDDRTHLGVAVRAWSDQVDATSRPIAVTRFLCVPLDGFSGTFTALHHAVDRWRDEPPTRVEPVEPRRGFPWHVAATVAALVVAGPVALVGADRLDLASRLALLDSVAALLPAGALSWLTAACWSDAGFRMVLSCKATAEPGDRVVDVRTGEAVGSLGPAARAYRDLLVGYCEQHGRDAVARYLAGLPDARDRDLGAVRAALAGFDQVKAVLRAAADRTLRPEQVRALDERGMFAALDPRSRLGLLIGYLDVACPEDVRRDATWLAAHWEPGATAHLARVAGVRLRRPEWRAGSVLALADLAAATGSRADFLDALAPGTGSSAFGGHLGRVIEVLVRLGESPEWTDEIARAVNGSPHLAIGLARALVAADGHPGYLLRTLAGQADEPTAWTRISRPFRVATGDTGAAEAEDIRVLHGIDGTVVRELIGLAARTGRTAVRGLMAGVLAYLESAPVDWSEWGVALTKVPLTDPEQQAAADFLLAGADLEPSRSLHAGRRYREALRRRVDSSGLSLGRRTAVVTRVAERLDPGWGAGAEVDDVLDALWHLGGDTAVVAPVVEVVADEARRDGRLLARPSAARWLPLLADDPELAVAILRNRLRGVAERAPVAEVADLVVRLSRAEETAEAVADALARSAWRPLTPQWAELFVVLTSRLHLAGDPRPDRLATALGTALLARWPRSRLDSTADELFGVLLGQAITVVRLVAHLAPVVGEHGVLALHRADLDQVLDAVEPVAARARPPHA